MNIALVTGASSGIGAEFVKQLAGDAAIEEIWLVARRMDLMKSLAKRIRKPVKLLALDLTKEEDINQLKVLLIKENPNIKILVNSAGYGIRKDFLKGSYAQEVGMIDINCKALTAVTYICLSHMHKNGKIIQVASAAAFLPQANFAVYSASKAYVLSFSRALHQELKKRGIAVTAICPGPVDTAFFQISDQGQNMPAYKKLFLVKPSSVVRKARKDSRRNKSISIYGNTIKLLRFVTRFL